MQTQDSQLREIQAGNEEVRKKLQVFRSGLQKLMSKKSSKKSQRHEPPSHDTKRSYQSQQSQYQYKSNSPIKQSPQQGNKLQQSQFGFNSTLFRQLNDQTVLSNNSSGVNEFYKQHNVQYDNNYGSVGSQNSQKTGQYYSTSTKKSQQVYNYQTFTPNINSTGINNNNNGDRTHYQLKQPQSFKKSSLLFSEIDQLMNRVNKSSKLPVKPIQKYINQQQNKLISESKQIDLSLSNSSLILSSDQNRGNLQFQKERKKQKPFQDNNNTKRSFKKEQNKMNKVSVRQSLKQTGDFLKNMKQRSSSIQSMKQPPLPPPQSFVKPLNNKREQQRINKEKREDFLEWGRKISQKMGKSRGQQGNEQQQQRRQQITQQKQQIRGQQKIANKVKSTINERKKLIKQEGLMDDSIVLQLSSQQQQQQQNNKNIIKEVQVGQNRNKVTLIEIKRLEQQKQLLLNELKQIQSQLQQLESQL